MLPSAGIMLRINGWQPVDASQLPFDLIRTFPAAEMTAWMSAIESGTCEKIDSSFVAIAV